jgi:hypothetical protein
MKITEEDLSCMDYTILFKKDDTIVAIATNGCVEEKFLVEEEAQDKIFDYISKSKHKSKFTVEPDMKKIYPIIDSFTDYAKDGLYAYDMHNGKETLVASPTIPLKVSDLPKKLQELLTEF